MTSGRRMGTGRADRVFAAMELLQPVESALAVSYKANLAQLPMMIRLLGLGQTLAMATTAATTRQGSEGRSWQTLLGHLDAWLGGRCPWSPLNQPATVETPDMAAGQRLLLRYRALDRQAMLVAQREATAFILVLHQFARVMVAPTVPASATAVEPGTAQ
jgi:hypothetical protein